MNDGAGEIEWVTGEAVIRDETGLHARPAVKVTKLAKSFASAVELRAADGAAWVNAKSPNAVMKLRAAHKTALQFRAGGDDADAAIRELTALVDRNFDE